MKKKVDFKVIQISLLIVIIVLLLMLCFMNLKHKKNENIDGTSKLWDIYDLNLTEMKYNLDKTMDKPKENVTCGNLKGITLKNGSYESLLNSLGCYITLYYYGLIEYNETYHNPITDYRNKHDVTEKDILNLKHNLKSDVNFYSNLKGMLTLKFDKEASGNDLYSVVSEFIDKFDDAFYDSSETYQEIFSYKLAEISYVTYLSDWLKNEYYNLVK